MLNKTVLITGGSGSLGNALIKQIKCKKCIIYSRDEYKHSLMKREYNYEWLRYFIGDVRDKDRLIWAMRGVDTVIHAAALKQVPALEYCPTEAIKTNIDGTSNVVEACLQNHVEKAVFISTDKAVNPVNLYGATKMAGEKLFLAANSYSNTKFFVVRYGNVLKSRGSVVELFLKMKQEGLTKIPITDERMTRFWITLENAAKFVLTRITRAEGGEVFIPEVKSMKITDLARAIIPDCEFEMIGVRPGEKIHESLSETLHSNTNTEWMTIEELRDKLCLNR